MPAFEKQLRALKHIVAETRMEFIISLEDCGLCRQYKISVILIQLLQRFLNMSLNKHTRKMGPEKASFQITTIESKYITTRYSLLLFDKGLNFQGQNKHSGTAKMFLLEVEDVDLMTRLYYSGFISVTEQAKLVIILHLEVFGESQSVLLSIVTTCMQN